MQQSNDAIEVSLPKREAGVTAAEIDLARLKALRDARVRVLLAGRVAPGRRDHGSHAR